MTQNDRADIEAVIEPGLPIVDPHHHLWLIPQATIEALEARQDAGSAILAAMYRNRPRFLFEELLADTTSGHNVRATVFLEAHAMYRADGPPELSSVGEVEFVNGVAAMAASGVFGDVRLCAGIVGNADLRRGDAARGVLEAHLRAGGDRYRGVRNNVSYDERPGTLSGSTGQPHVLLDPAFRAGFRHLQPLGLSFDLAVAAPQLPEVADLAQAFPQTQIILNHLGGAGAAGPDGKVSREEFTTWRDRLRLVAGQPNVTLKLGGLGNPISGLPLAGGAQDSETLAQAWRPYIETGIEAFGPDRCMFESNFPVDGMTASYRVVWNAYKRIAAGASADEKAALFFGSARRVYRLDI